MKKQIIIASLLIATGFSAFGQGFFVFGTGARFVWDDFTSPAQNAVVAPGNVNVAFLWAPTNGFPVAAIGSSGNATNDTALGLSGNPWAAIMSGADAFTLATNSGTGALATIADTAAGVTKGNINYNAQAAFSVAGTTAGNIYEVFIIGWDATFADPFLAAAANAAVGWSGTFIYASGVTSSATTAGPPPSLFSASGASPFGVSPVPEPTTFALAGLGAASLLIFRRRKQ